MGVYVNLSVARERIRPQAWRQVFAESERVLEAYRRGGLSLHRREIAGEEVIAYTRNLRWEDQRGLFWRISADAESKLSGETFEFPRDYGKAADGDGLVAPGEDLLVTSARSKEIEGARVFGAKTQGRAYHEVVVAVVTLVENRFPGAALAWGDMTASDGERACALLEEALGERFEPPVVLDRRRLRSRLAHDGLEDAVERLLISEPHSLVADLVGLLSRQPMNRFIDDLEAAVSCRDVAQLWGMTRFAIAVRAQAVRQTIARAELGAQLGSMSSTALLAAIARCTSRRRLHLTDDAWDEIEQAGVDLLRFLVVLAASTPGELTSHTMSRAILESAAVRRFAFEHWDRGEEPVSGVTDGVARAAADALKVLGIELTADQGERLLAQILDRTR